MEHYHVAICQDTDAAVLFQWEMFAMSPAPGKNHSKVIIKQTLLND